MLLSRGVKIPPHVRATAQTLCPAKRTIIAGFLEHDDRHFKLGLNEPEKTDLIEYLKSL